MRKIKLYTRSKKVRKLLGILHNRKFGGSVLEDRKNNKTKSQENNEKKCICIDRKIPEN